MGESVNVLGGDRGKTVGDVSEIVCVSLTQNGWNNVNVLGRDRGKTVGDVSEIVCVDP